VSTQLALDTLEIAINNRETQPEIFHSYRGSQYTAKRFRQKHDQLNILQSFSQPGYPYDNSVTKHFSNTSSNIVPIEQLSTLLKKSNSLVFGTLTDSTMNTDLINQTISSHLIKKKQTILSKILNLLSNDLTLVHSLRKANDIK